MGLNYTGCLFLVASFGAVAGSGMEPAPGDFSQFDADLEFHANEAAPQSNHVAYKVDNIEPAPGDFSQFDHDLEFLANERAGKLQTVEFAAFQTNATDLDDELMFGGM